MGDNQSALDTLIKTKFNLFKGARSQEEDQKIYDKVIDLCFEEMLAFLGENLSDGEREVMLEELDKNDTDEGKAKVFETFASRIDGFQAKFAPRIDHYLNEILISSINTKTQ